MDSFNPSCLGVSYLKFLCSQTKCTTLFVKVGIGNLGVTAGAGIDLASEESFTSVSGTVIDESFGNFCFWLVMRF